MLRSTFVRLSRGLVLPLLLVAAAGGCGGGKGDVSGSVTVNGEPLPMGAIVFTPQTGPSVAAEIVDGKYSATGVPSGPVKVSLDLRNLRLLEEQNKPRPGVGAPMGKGSVANAKEKSLHPGSNPNLPEAAKAQIATSQKGQEEADRRAKEGLKLLKQIPEKYTDPNQSGWALTVTGGSNTFDAQVAK